MNHKFGRVRFTNCWIVALSLIFQGRAKSVIIRVTKWLPHPLVITKKGNIVHFTNEGRFSLKIIMFGRMQVFKPALLRREKYWKLF